MSSLFFAAPMRSLFVTWLLGAFAAMGACANTTTDAPASALTDAGSDGASALIDGGAGCPRAAPDVGESCNVAFPSCAYSTGECVTNLACTNGQWSIATVKCPPAGGSRCELAGGRCGCDCDVTEMPGEGQLGDSCARSASCGVQVCCFERADAH